MLPLPSRVYNGRPYAALSATTRDNTRMQSCAVIAIQSADSSTATAPSTSSAHSLHLCFIPSLTLHLIGSTW